MFSQSASSSAVLWAFLPWDVLILVPVKSSHKAAGRLYICACELPVCRPQYGTRRLSGKNHSLSLFHFNSHTQGTIQFFIDLSRGLYTRSRTVYYCEFIIISQPKHILLKTSHLLSMFQSHVVAINSQNIPVHFDTCKTANMRFTRGADTACFTAGWTCSTLAGLRLTDTCR